jgi:hypothetical protein
MSAGIFVTDYLRPAALKWRGIADGQRFGLHSFKSSLATSIACPASVIPGTLFSQMTIVTTSRDPSTAAEFTLLHAASRKLRNNLPNLFPCPSFCRGYVL